MKWQDRLKHDLRMTLPPWWSFVAFVVLLVGFEMPRFIASRVADADVLQSMKIVGCEIAIVAAAVAHGVWRVVGFSPLFRTKYAEWLQLTPWAGRDPLPLGPVQLVWPDLLIPGALTLISMMQSSVPVWFAATISLGAYMAVSTLSFLATRLWVHAYLMLFGVGLLALTTTADGLWYFAIVLAGLYAVVRLGLTASLAAFPCSPLVELQNLEMLVPRAAPESHGWPHDALRPDPEPAHVPHPHGALLGLLAGWLTFAAALTAEKFGEPAEEAAWLAVLVAIAVFVIRTLVYKFSHATPISLWGRMCTGRWIIPGHDRVFVPQLIVVMVAVSGLALAEKVPALVWIPVSVSITVACGLSMRPTRKEWILLGHHQLRGAWIRAGEVRRV